MADRRSDKDKAPVNFISIMGFIIALLSLPLFFLCIGQLAGMALSIVGFIDAKKCGDRGIGLSLAGIIISTSEIFLTLFIFIYALCFGVRYSEIDVAAICKIIALFIR